MDTLSSQARSELMGRIKASHTGPERALRGAVERLGLRPSRGACDVEGNPDLPFKRARVAVFVDGCFWHGCSAHGRLPRSDSTGYWEGKIGSNKERDKRVGAMLLSKGWICLRFWEHEIKMRGGADLAAGRIAQAVALRQA